MTHDPLSHVPAAPEFRILVIDDNSAIHDDFDKILRGSSSGERDLAAAERALFGPSTPDPHATRFVVDHALQGREGFDRAREAQAAGRPYAVIFVDVRMPPGWDGIETISHLWQHDPTIQVVVCTAYSDHSWAEIVRRLGSSDAFVILKKPFDPIEVLQLTHALARKWDLARQVRGRLEALDGEVRSRAAELEAANIRLVAEFAHKERIEHELRSSEARFASAFAASPIPMMMLAEPDGQIVDVNPAFETLSGRHRPELVGRTLAESGMFRSVQQLANECRQVVAGAMVRQQAHDLQSRPAGERNTLVSIASIGLPAQPHLLLVVEDVTERTAMQKELLHATKMEVVGQLAAGVAHDFNNILAVIQGHASLASSTDGLRQEVIDSLSEILSASQRATALTRQLLAFSRKQVIQRRAIDVNATLHGVEKMMRRLVGDHIKIEWMLGDRLPRVFADAGCLEQILINLAVNARDAMPGGGTIRIVTDRHTADVTESNQHRDRRPGEYVRVGVLDSGHGIAPEIEDRVFEPFFTTKEVGKGTGLGLATVYGILRQHGGWIDFQSEVGRGTAFEFCLPVAGPEVATSEEQPPLGPWTPVPVGMRALLAEDEPSVRNLTVAILRRAGYDVAAAANGAEASRIFNGTPDGFDLLVTDVVMPGGISGLELAVRLRLARPSLPVVVMSGYTLDVTDDLLGRLSGAVFLQKPFDRNALLAAISTARKNTAVPA